MATLIILTIRKIKSSGQRWVRDQKIRRGWCEVEQCAPHCFITSAHLLATLFQIINLFIGAPCRFRYLRKDYSVARKCFTKSSRLWILKTTKLCALEFFSYAWTDITFLCFFINKSTNIIRLIRIMLRWSPAPSLSSDERTPKRLLPPQFTFTIIYPNSVSH